MPVPHTLLSWVETIVCFGVAAVLLWLSWGLWRRLGRRATGPAGRALAASRLLAFGPALMAACFLLLGGLSVAYPFDMRGTMHLPSQSPAAGVQLVAFALLPTGVVLIALAQALAARGVRSR